jgi:transcriptional regulator with XRE-family HTH domain
MEQLDIKVFGRRVATVRESIFNMTQIEFAENINSNQALLSRLERGEGAAITAVFDIINFLNKKGFQGDKLFATPFSIDLIKQKNFSAAFPDVLKEVSEKVDSLKQHNNDELVKINTLVDFATQANGK